MRVEWHGQSAFTLRGEEGAMVIDPFGDVSSMRERGIQWDYPAIEAPDADLVLVTHEHRDHNGVEVVDGEPAILRAQAGRHDSPFGEVDLVFLPVGGGPTIGGEVAAMIARELERRWVVPMHYRTERIGFLETEEEFVEAMGEPHRLSGPFFETDELPGGKPTAVIVSAVP